MPTPPAELPPDWDDRLAEIDGAYERDVRAALDFD
jgi:hypothetical protein